MRKTDTAMSTNYLAKFLSIAHIKPKVGPRRTPFLVKTAPWDDINFRFYFNISMKPEVTQTNNLYT